MGDKRVKILLKKYKNIKMIGNLSPEKINIDTGLSIKIAKDIIKKANEQK